MIARALAVVALVLVVAAWAVCAACDNGGATPDWSRMITQPKLLPFGATTLFDDGAAMRSPPNGTISRGWIADARHRDGRDDTGLPAATIPLPITRALIDRGRDRFAITCAACHGIAGDGDSAVAHNMERRRPPSLHEPRLVALSPGEVYRVIVDGYGLMPSYATMLEVDDRWAVVAYVRTLQLSWRARLDELPAAIASDAARRLP